MHEDNKAVFQNTNTDAMPDLETASVEQPNTVLLAIQWFPELSMLFYIGEPVTRQRKFK